MQSAVCDILAVVTLQQTFSMQHEYRWRKTIFSLTFFFAFWLKALSDEIFNTTASWKIVQIFI